MGDNGNNSHLIIDLWDAINLDDLQYNIAVIKECIAAVEGTLIYLISHDFGEGKGVTVIAMLAESHISIHTWPEKG